MDSQFLLQKQNEDDTFGTVDEQWTAVLRVANSIAARNKYLYGLQIVGIYACGIVCW